MKWKSPIGTQGKGISMAGVDSCIAKDQKCTIIAEFGKKSPAQTADGGLLLRDCLVTSSPFNCLYDYCKQFTIMIVFPSLSEQLQPCANLESVEF